MNSPSICKSAMLALFLPFIALVPSGALPEQKTVIGEVEDVILLPWRIRLPARIDTGAARTSLGAQNLKISGVVAEFKLREAVGGQRLRLPILDWRVYRTSEGTDRRPIVEIEICIGRKRLRTRVNLNRRHHLEYPFLVGRGLLAEGNFLVDVTQSHTVEPDCAVPGQPESTSPPARTPDK